MSKPLVLRPTATHAVPAPTPALTLALERGVLRVVTSERVALAALISATVLGTVALLRAPARPSAA